MSNPVSLVGVDQAGGKILGPGKPNWTWNGIPMSVQGDAVEPHAPGPHMAATIKTGSPWMSIDGIPVTRATSPATCDHVASGSAQMFIP
ncbi:hypothetical protein D3C73_205150 [compost metagenome]|jgi:uncharacterized Zn-binding protein involved in type VI secretion